MYTKYVPILKWKAGEKSCLENLSSTAINSIIPFIEVSTPSDSDKEETAEKKMNKLLTSFNSCWEEKPFYFHLTNDWYENIDDISQISNIYESLYHRINHPNAIPAFDISDEINISNLSNLGDTNGVCLYITISNFEQLSDILNAYIMNSWIIPENTDLLIDLKYIDNETYPLRAALTTVLSDITNISSYRRIIISSCSFPKNLSKLQSNIVNEFPRLELSIHHICQKLQKTFSFNYIYSDYGPANLNDSGFVIGMIPNFKIKYSTVDKYLVVKGLSIKRGGLELPNVSPCCKLLMTHPSYSGEDFSYGDKIIYSTANGTNPKPGNLTNWVCYSFNHHIELIVSSL